MGQSQPKRTPGPSKSSQIGLGERTELLTVRCLACWTLAWWSGTVKAHPPACVRQHCSRCDREFMHAVVGQVVGLRPRRDLHHLHEAQKNGSPVKWEQLSLMTLYEQPD